MQSIVNPQTRVLVGCRGDVSESHRLVRLARYEWSADEAGWERIDRHGSDDDWFLQRAPEGGMQAYPRPSFDCPLCKKDRVYAHETLQTKLQKAAEDDGLLLI